MGPPQSTNLPRRSAEPNSEERGICYFFMKAMIISLQETNCISLDNKRRKIASPNNKVSIKV